MPNYTIIQAIIVAVLVRACSIDDLRALAQMDWTNPGGMNNE